MPTKKTITFQLDTADLTLTLAMLDADRGAVSGFSATSGVIIAGETFYWATLTLPTGTTDGYLQVRNGSTLLREIAIGLGFEVADRTAIGELASSVQAIGSAVGPGGVPHVLTFTVGGGPLPDGSVWVSIDEDGENIVAGTLQTNSLGKVSFLLDNDVTYYAWLRKDGVNPVIAHEFTTDDDDEIDTTEAAAGGATNVPPGFDN